MLLTIIVILRSGHAFSAIFVQSFYLNYIPAAIAIFLILVNIKNLKLQNQFGALFIFMLTIGCSLLVDRGAGFKYYEDFIIIILAAYGISELYSFEKMAACYVRIMTVVTVIAIIGYFLVNFTNLLSGLPSMSNNNDVEFKVGIVFNYIPIIPDRNCGMFWEPGLFATHIVIASIVEIIVKHKISIIKLLLFTIGIITANSSAGFALWFLFLIFIFANNNKGKPDPLRAIFSVILLVAAISLIVNFDNILSSTSLGDNAYLQKLSSDSIFSSSRVDAILHNLELFASGPIFGAGYTTINSQMAHVADTSTTTYLMSLFGIGGAFYTILLIFGIFKLKSQNIFAKIVLLVIVLIIINKEPHHQLLSSWIILFYIAKGTDEKNQMDIKQHSNVFEKGQLKWG